MLILTIRTDKPEAEIGLFTDQIEESYYRWEAHQQLAETIHQKIKDLLDSKKTDWPDINGILVYHGPGSFTGLRIGISVANSLSAGLEVSVVGSSGDDWVQKGIDELINGTNQVTVLPEYDRPVHITQPKH